MDANAYRPGRRNWHNTTPVRKQDPRRTRWLWLFLVAVLVAFAPILTYLDQRNRNTELGYQIERVKKATEKAREIERHLHLERAALETLPRAERAARELGLTPPGPDAVVMVRIGSPAPRNLMARAPDDETDAP